MTQEIRLTVNGEARAAVPDEGETLLHFLRTKLLLTGAKEGCKEGVCGACTVLLNGAPVHSCKVPALAADGANVETVEGLAKDGALHPLQQAFLDEGVVQCGYCTPGMLMTCKAMLDTGRVMSEEEIRAGLRNNICRCGTYPAVVRALRSVMLTRQ